METLYKGADFDDSKETESIRNIVACSDYIKGNFPEKLRGRVLSIFRPLVP